MRANKWEDLCPTDVDLNMNCHRTLQTLHTTSNQHENDTHDTDQIITLNVGGAIFQTSYSTLRNIPNTRLCTLAEELPKAYQGKPRYFFDRNPQLFNFILDFYRTGELHLPKGHCAFSLKRELHFWGLNEACVSECCWAHYVKSTNQYRQYKKLREEFRGMGSGPRQEHFGSWREKVWHFVEDPRSSCAAKIYAVVTNLLILINVFTYMLGTLPSFRVTHGQDDHVNTSSVEDPTKLQRWMTTTEHPGIIYFDIACLFFFFFECLLRFVSCPNKKHFFRSFKTIADLFYIVPLSVLHIVYMCDHTVWSEPRNIPALLILQGFVAFRVCRLVLVARNYRPFVILILSLKASGRELLLLVIMVMLALVFFSNAIFLAEITHEGTFNDVFEGLWWSLITITTVGYGDVVPKTTFGFVVGSICAVSGLILISLPIPVIAKNFNSYYSFKRKPTALIAIKWMGGSKSPKVGTEETLIMELDCEERQNCRTGHDQHQDPQRPEGNEMEIS
ncbi:potassium voltage-gated channel protein Shaw-like [Liolophura sinensis]|uniref:potassium voltage-gated channel protein Shaw-like n=1 Tax=Liolophura sinensis TaxID=3198878 RepID=UPI00315934AB